MSSQHRTRTPTGTTGRRAATAVVRASLLAAAVGVLAAAAPGCRPADGQTPAMPAVRVSDATPRADSGVVQVARQLTPAVVYIQVQIPQRAVARDAQGALPPGFQLPPGFDGPGSPLAPAQARGPARASGAGVLL